MIKSSRHLKRVFFCLNKKKKIKNTGDFVVEEVSSFIQKIKSKLKNINLSLFNEFLGKKQIIRFTRQNQKKNEQKEKKIKVRMKHKKIIDYNGRVQKAFALASKIDKTKSEPKPEESVAERVKLRR